LALCLSQVCNYHADAQTGGRPTIAVAATIAVQASTRVPFPIRVGQVPPNSFVRVRGLPTTASLSDGHAISPGTWAVPLNALADLTMAVPSTVKGSVEVVVTLVGSDGSVLTEARTTLVFSPSATTASSSSPYDQQRAQQYLQKGREQLAQGLVAPARQLFERAADLGLAEAAMALGETYDAAELGQPHLRGIQPDPKEARRWYERARVLGAPNAEQRLLRLGAN
jgi:hypothetical protein